MKGINAYLFRSRRRMVTLAVAAAGAGGLLLGVSPAAADPDVATGTIAGTGTISPGLTATPTPQSFTFTGSGQITSSGAGESGTYTCSVSGNSTVAGETYANGQGSFSGSCSGPHSITVSGGTYVRVGPTVTAEGNAKDITDDENGHFVAQCVFEADQTPPAPVTSFHLVCSVSLESAA